MGERRPVWQKKSARLPVAGGIGYTPPHHICGAGACIQFRQQLVVSRISFAIPVAVLPFQAGHLAVAIVDVAERDRLSGTDLLASRLDFAILDSPVFFF